MTFCKAFVSSQDFIAYNSFVSPTAKSGVCFLGGFTSSRKGTKATAFEQFCQDLDLSYVRFDYRGHGDSSGLFKDMTLSHWLEDTLYVFDHLTSGPQIIVGSSMGGWLMLLLALKRPQRIKGLLGIAAAPDFTQTLIWNALSDEDKKVLETVGYIEKPTIYETPHVFTKKMIQDGENHLLLQKPIPLNLPLRLFHGMKDTDVPYETSLKILELITSQDSSCTLIKDGDHFLTRLQDLLSLKTALQELSEKVV